MKNRKKYKRIVYTLLTISMFALCIGTIDYLKNAIPDRFLVEESGELPEVFHNGADAFLEKHVVENSFEKYGIAYSLLGKIPLKTVSVSVTPKPHVFVGGQPIGIYLQTRGVLVIDTEKIVDMEGTTCAPAENIVQRGDYIQAVNGKMVATKEEVVKDIADCCGSEIILDMDRDGKFIKVKLHPALDTEGNYKAGIWVRNDTQGIGTLTYVQENGTFGALGHGISDVDTGEVIKINKGTLYEAEVLSIVRGRQGSPGELSGVIHYNEGYKIGEIYQNDENGIYGKIYGVPDYTKNMDQMEVAYKQEIETGPASIRCTVGDKQEEFSVEIQEIRMNCENVNKGLIVKVTDERLLQQTGGIVQGMSGSPILQNGRLVGAITHVLVNDPTRGYGIIAENMLKMN